MKLQISVGIDDFSYCVSGSGVPRAIHVASLRTPDDEPRSHPQGSRPSGPMVRLLQLHPRGTDLHQRGRCDQGPGGRPKAQVHDPGHPSTNASCRRRHPGRGPVGATIQVSVDRGGFAEVDLGVARDVTVNGRGRWRLDLSGHYDIKGTDQISVALADDGLYVFSNSLARTSSSTPAATSWTGLSTPAGL